MEEKKQPSTKENQLPKRKFNSPVSRIVCWKCKRWGNIRMSKLNRERFDIPAVILYRLRYPNGIKSPDYACQDHKDLGVPPVGNVSQIFFQYAE